MKALTKSVPEAALKFKAPRVSIDLLADKHSVTLLARSGLPIEHWFWGNIVHDLSGMKLSKDRVPIDYAHNAGEIIGYLSEFGVTPRGLQVSGELVIFKDDDRAAEVAHKSAAGIPYEASINFGGDGIKIEELSDGDSTEVNGFEFEGPGVVVREWPLRGVAICPYGADSNTESEVFNDQGRSVSVEVLSEEKDMADEKRDAEEAQEVAEDSVEEVDAEEQTTDETESAEEATDVSEDVVEEEAVEPELETAELSDDDSRGECRRFIESFGPQGGVWFSEGMAFADASELFLQGIITERDELRSMVDQLKSQLASVDRGEGDPLDFTIAPVASLSRRDELTGEFKKQLGNDAAAAFAARFKDNGQV